MLLIGFDIVLIFSYNGIIRKSDISVGEAG